MPIEQRAKELPGASDPPTADAAAFDLWSAVDSADHFL